MEIEITARATGPFGELSRRQRMLSPAYPEDYLRHLVDIGVARILTDHRPVEKIETKIEKKSTDEVKSTLLSPAAPQSQSQTSKKSMGTISLQSTRTTK